MTYNFNRYQLPQLFLYFVGAGYIYFDAKSYNSENVTLEMNKNMGFVLI